MIYFLMGYLVRNKMTEIQKVYQSIKFRKDILFAVIFAAWGVCVGILVEFESNPVLNLIAALLGIVSMWMAAEKISNQKNYLFNQFSKYSLPLYLMNGYLLVISRTVVVSKLGITNPFVIISFNMFVTLFLSWIFIKYVIDRVKVFRIIFGMG